MKFYFVRFPNNVFSLQEKMTSGCPVILVVNRLLLEGTSVYAVGRRFLEVIIKKDS
jgi:hypothetical protein